MVNLTTTDRDTRFGPKADTDLAIRRRLRRRPPRTPAGAPPAVPPSTRPSTRDVTNNSPITGLGGLLKGLGGGAKSLAGDILGSGLARGIGRVASEVDRPISERLGINLPGPVEEELTRPTNLLFALGGAPGLAGKIPAIFRPVVAKGGIAGAFAGEAALSAAARTGADIGAQTGLPGAGLVGGLAGGLAIGGVLGGLRSFDTAGEEALFGRQQAGDFFEDEFRILNGGSDDILVTDGRLVPVSVTKITDGLEDARQDTAVHFDTSDLADDRLTNEARIALNEWVQGNTTRIRNVSETGQQTLPSAFVKVTIPILRRLYEMGEPFRKAAKALSDVNPDGTITMLRGEKGYAGETFELVAKISEPQAIQSYSTQKTGAAFFAVNGDSFGNIDTIPIIQRNVPIDDIIVNPVGIVEAEVLVLDRNKIPDDLYFQITGKQKSELGILAGPIDISGRGKTTGGFGADALPSLRRLVKELELESTQLSGSELKTVQDEIIRLNKIIGNISGIPPHESRTFVKASAELERKLLEDQIDTIERNLTVPLDELTSAVRENEEGLITSAKEKLKNIIKFINKEESGSITVGAATGLPLSQVDDLARGVENLRSLTERAKKNGLIFVGRDKDFLPESRQLLDMAGVTTAVARKLDIPTTQPTGSINLSTADKTNKELIDETLSSYESSRRASVPDGGTGGRGTTVGDAGAGGGQPPVTAGGTRGTEPPDSFKGAVEKESRGNKDIFTQLNTLLRTLWATLDGSWWGIQGLLNAVDDPILTAKSMRQAIEAVSDPEVLTDYLRAVDQLFLNKNIIVDGEQLTVELLEKRGLQIAHNQGTEFSIAEDTFLGKTPGIKQANRLFSASGDFMRINKVMALVEMHGVKELDGIIGAVNRSTGVSSGRLLGQPGNVLLFAPRFFQSQLEVVAKAVSDGTIEGKIARQQLAKLVGLGVMTTVIMNHLNGEETVFDPRDSNFMRIRNIKGVDISVFGPWDSLVRGVIRTGQGDFAYFPRTKASPIISTAWDLISGRNFLGEESRNPKTLVKSLAMPFAWQDLGTEPLMGSALGFFGVKSSPLTRNELLENKMIAAGRDPEDPLDRRQYLIEHPDDLPKARTEEQESAELVRNETDVRQELLEAQVLNGSMTLAEFREARKVISREQRTKLNILLGSFDREPKNAQQQWIKTYYDLFDQAKDPITGELNGETLDRLQAQWISLFGTTALRYVNEFSLTGKGEVDSRYLNALIELESKGFFSINRLRGMRSDLTEDQIEDYRLKVQAARFADPRLANVDFRLAVNMVLRELNLSSQEIRDVINSGSGVFRNPEYTRFLNENKELVVWFNPAARWSTLEAVTEQQ